MTRLIMSGVTLEDFVELNAYLKRKEVIHRVELNYFGNNVGEVTITQKLELNNYVTAYNMAVKKLMELYCGE